MAGTVTEAVADMLPAVAVLGALALFLFGVRPRLQSPARFAYCAAALIAHLGEPLDLPDIVNDLSPFKLVGNPPVETAAPATLAGMVSTAVLLVTIGFVGFRNRGVPQH